MHSPIDLFLEQHGRLAEQLRDQRGQCAEPDEAVIGSVERTEILDALDELDARIVPGRLVIDPMTAGELRRLHELPGPAVDGFPLGAAEQAAEDEVPVAREIGQLRAGQLGAAALGAGRVGAAAKKVAHATRAPNLASLRCGRIAARAWATSVGKSISVHGRPVMSS